jgi:hypothetical protein
VQDDLRASVKLLWLLSGAVDAASVVVAELQRTIAGHLDAQRAALPEQLLRCLHAAVRNLVTAGVAVDDGLAPYAVRDRQRSIARPGSSRG